MAARKTSIKLKSPRVRPAVGAPHSWELATWPENVWPHDSKRGQWISRAYRKELLQAGAITRIGMKLIFIGARYTTWLERRAYQVAEFHSNNPEIGKRRLVEQAHEGC